MTSAPRALLIHDGELDDVRTLLDDLGAHCDERRGGVRESDEQVEWELVVATSNPMLELGVGAVGRRPVRIAVLEKDSPTLREALRAAEVDFMVARPVHPVALRLLLLHALYRGPERRREPRVSVGAAVYVRTGLRRRSAVLAELSTGGCRLVTRRPLQRSRRITVYLPSQLGGGEPLRLRGRVLRGVQSPWDESRCDPEGLELPGSGCFAVRFEGLTPQIEDRLRAAIAAHAAGPAVLERDPEASEAFAYQTPPEVAACDAPEQGEVTAFDLVEDAPQDRRSRPRRMIARHIIALGDQAARVLLGRDISADGMRVDPNPGIATGDALRLALHARAGDAPLVVAARVARDDGDAGLWLRFVDLSPEDSARLEELLRCLPLLTASDGGEEDHLMVWEILEPGARAG